MRNTVEEGLAAAVSRSVRRTEPGEVALVRQAGWAAAPLPSGAHLSIDDQARILTLCGDQPGLSLWAVPLELLQGMTEPLRVDASQEGLQGFNRQLSFYDCALVATVDGTIPAWIVACFADDYLIALGPVALLPALCGVSVEGAFGAFAAYAQDPEWPLRSRRVLLAVCAAVLRYAGASPGTEVTVPEPEA